MDLFLDGEGPVTRQLFRALREAIQEGRLAPGARLPPTRDLSLAHGVSRGTVVAAYELLRAHGLVESRTGSGTYVCRRPALALLPDRPAPAEVPPQSAFARRARSVHDHDRIPGKRVAGARIDFQYGMVTPPAGLQARWRRLLSRAKPFETSGYPPVQGLPQLRRAIASHIGRSRGVQCTPEDVVVVSGVQQAMALVARVLLEPGDIACIEEPGYIGLRRILQMHGANLQLLPTDADGARVDLLSAHPAKLVCLTPSHQFPTGVVLSAPRRRDVLAYAAVTGAWILEDDYDGEFRQDGPPLPSLKSIDSGDRVIYVGSFSKTLFASLRLAYMVVPPGLRRDFVNGKWAMDFGSPALEQTLVADLIESGDYDRHLRHLSRRLKAKRELLQRVLAQALGDSIEIHPARTGMHLLAWVPALTAEQGEQIIAEAARDGIGLHPVAPCFQTPPAVAGFMLGFGGLSMREVAIGASRFADYVLRHLPAGAARRRVLRAVR